MIVAITIGRKNSKGFPNKNLKKIDKIPLMAYPIISANKTTLIDHVYLCSDSKEMNNIGKKYGAKIIDRPKKLSTDRALGEDVFKYCYDELKKKFNNIEIVILLFCNTLCLNSKSLSEGIKILKKNKQIDSVVSVSKYNMWSPLRARKINKYGLLKPFVPFENFGNPKTLNCDRDSQGDVWFADMGFSIVKSHCLENMKNGLLPQKWMGNKIFPFKQEAGFDLDYEWQMPSLKYWKKTYRKN